MTPSRVTVAECVSSVAWGTVAAARCDAEQTRLLGMNVYSGFARLVSNGRRDATRSCQFEVTVRNEGLPCNY
ncbi:hypothetical protein F4776DRAFT_621383 [Hypoxylon sp. NC0597]|nr:hypothetical protein F4776DRAFT_621383 [Hypoxylon sp. NC0597]